ncbi:MAG: XRE family transcriptional regulator [Desulfobacteraceae bacterium]|nr:MAG: XRE family transcriptional regulator [Desulfobacteraceae bacterium]
MDVKEMIGRRIREIRTKKGLTQEELAEKMGMGPKYLSSIERGKENPTLNTLIALAESLDVAMGEMFNFVELEDTSKLPVRIREMIKGASEKELKVILKVVSAVLY